MSVVALLALDGIPAHQLTTPGLVLAAAARAHPRARYDLRICSTGGAVRTAGPAPLTVTAPWGLDALADAAVLLLPGHDGFLAAPPAAVLDAVRAVAGRGGRIAAVGTGTFTLAATGLLDGRRATTVWSRLPELAARHPRVEADPSGTLVADGPFLTSAGIFGGLDLLVRLVRDDHGPQAAAAAVRHLLAPLNEAAGAIRAEMEQEIAATADLRPTLAWMEAELHRPLTLTDLAGHARTSVRSLNRRFREHTGLSPLQYLLRARLDRARHLLEQGECPVEEVAVRAGFTSPESLRHHFRRATGTTPRAYRTARRAASLTPPGR